MGNFRQHITCSTATGIAAAGIAYHFGFPPPVCLVSAGLCSFAGMLPDIDSDTSKSFHECIYLTAGIGCILTASRLRQYGIDSDLALLGGAFMFLFIRFGLAVLIKATTNHRGMIHSIPVAFLFGELTFFLVTGTVEERFVKAAALTAGFLSHLVLDEVYSIDSTGKTLRLKKSFGTALKWTNPKKKKEMIFLYAAVFYLGYAVCIHPEMIEGENGTLLTENGLKSVLDNESLSSRYVNPWWSQFSGEIKEDLKELQSDIKREAEEFLAKRNATPIQGVAASAEQPYLTNIVLDNLDAVLSDTELPPMVQFGNEWNGEHPPMQPARIALP